MKRYAMSFAASLEHKPEHPERTAKRQLQNWDVEFGVWTNRAALLKTIEMQEKREHRNDDWRLIVKRPYDN